jgi:acyl carrier protein
VNEDLYPAVASVLTEQFNVAAERITPDATLDSLGLDSLALMEFVFAIEDKFSVRIPEERLDPRQSGVTLTHLAEMLREQLPRASAAPVES